MKPSLLVVILLLNFNKIIIVKVLSFKKFLLSYFEFYFLLKFFSSETFPIYGNLI